MAIFETSCTVISSHTRFEHSFFNTVQDAVNNSMNELIKIRSLLELLVAFLTALKKSYSNRIVNEVHIDLFVVRSSLRRCEIHSIHSRSLQQTQFGNYKSNLPDASHGSIVLQPQRVLRYVINIFFLQLRPITFGMLLSILLST